MMQLRLVTVLLTLSFLAHATYAQNTKARHKPQPFGWVNPLKRQYAGVTHATFKSPSMQLDVGYCIYRPPAYDKAGSEDQRFAVVYYLHGGRPGSEIKSVRLAAHIHRHIVSGAVPPMIYVFVNGGPVSH